MVEMKVKTRGRTLRNRSLIAKDINVRSKSQSLKNKILFNNIIFPHSEEKEELYTKKNINRTTAKSKIGQGVNKNVKEYDLFSDQGEYELTAILEHNFENQGNRLEESSSLTSKNLMKLQKDILEKETENISCGHFLCSVENRQNLPFRLWFLFEMELSEDSHSNFRNRCYHNQVYKELDSNWRMKPCLTEETMAENENFLLQQLIIPTIHVSPKIESQCLNTLQVNIGDVIGDEGHTKMPPSLLAKRNLKEIFDQTPVKAEKILSNTNGSSSNLTVFLDSDVGQETCSLLKKLGARRALNNTTNESN